MGEICVFLYLSLHKPNELYVTMHFVDFILQFGAGSNYAVWAKQNGRLYGYMSRCLRTSNTLQLGQLAVSANKGFLHPVSCVPASEKF